MFPLYLKQNNGGIIARILLITSKKDNKALLKLPFEGCPSSLFKLETPWLHMCPQGIDAKETYEGAGKK
jgi:hypothetical protein